MSSLNGVRDTKPTTRDGSLNIIQAHLRSPEFNSAYEDVFVQSIDVFANIHVCNLSTIHLAIAYHHSLIHVVKVFIKKARY